MMVEKKLSVMFSPLTDKGHMKVKHILPGIPTASLERENGVYTLKLKKKIDFAMGKESTIGNISIVSLKGRKWGS